jgi:hypothetical protein
LHNFNLSNACAARSQAGASQLPQVGIERCDCEEESDTDSQGEEQGGTPRVRICPCLVLILRLRCTGISLVQHQEKP